MEPFGKVKTKTKEIVINLSSISSIIQWLSTMSSPKSQKNSNGKSNPAKEKMTGMSCGLILWSNPKSSSKCISTKKSAIFLEFTFLPGKTCLVLVSWRWRKNFNSTTTFFQKHGYSQVTILNFDSKLKKVSTIATSSSLKPSAKEKESFWPSKQTKLRMESIMLFNNMFQGHF